MARVVILTGPQCSGKTSLARALRSQPPFPAVHVDADRMFPRLPEAHPRWITKSGAMQSSFHRSMAAWMAGSFGLIGDGSLPSGMSRPRSGCLHVFAPSRTLLVVARNA